MSQKKVSIIIPTSNRIKELRKALESVFHQTYKNWEIVIIDNYSNDGTDEYIRNLNEKRVIYKKYKNEGIIGASRNKGINYSEGFYLAFLDSDDWWEKNKLEKCIETINSRKSDFVYHNCYIKGENISSRTYARQLKKPIYDDLLRNGNTIITSSVVVKKELIIKAGCFSEKSNICGWEDYDLWIKISKMKKNFILIPEILGSYGMGEDKFDNSERILLNITNMYNCVLKEYKDKTGIEPWWPLYTKALANLRIGNIRIARKLLIKNILFNSPNLSKLKSLYYFFKSFT